MSSHPVHADWSLLHNRFYRKLEVYSMQWRELDLSKFTVAAAPFGGPIALVRNDRKLLKAKTFMSRSVQLFSSAGKLIHQFEWEKGHIVGMGWTETEHLVCILESGVARLYDLQGDFVQFSLGEDAKEFGILDCRIWETGLVVLTGNLKLWTVTDFLDPRPRALSDPGLTQECPWCIIPPQQTLSGHLEVLLAMNGSVVLVDATSAQDQMVQNGPFTALSISPNGKFLALFTAEGKLWVVSSDFQKNLAEFSTNSPEPPLQMSWCGTDSVILHWENIILVVGPFGDWIKYTIEGSAHLVTEIDGVRIITNDACMFLQRVPAPTEDVFKIGSTSAGAILYDAWDHFGKKSPRAEENIRNISGELAIAVDVCLEAAAHEFDQNRQTTLLKAASFGKGFLDTYDSEKFVRMCQTIRIMNAMRDHEIGIPLTFTQYLRLTPEVLVNRLVNRNHHYIAIKICDYLKLSKERALVHWACSKIKKPSGDYDSVYRAIVDRLSAEKTTVSFAEIAKTAYQYGHIRLAADLLDHEVKAAYQVPLLMSMERVEQDDRALVKAIESGDTDLVYAVILHIKRKHPIAEFFRLLRGKPLALSLVESYAKQQDILLLKDFYTQDDRRTECANVMLSDSFEQTIFASRISKLKETIRLYQEDKERGFEARAIEDQLKLLQAQQALERDLGHRFFDLSISETIYRCLMVGQPHRAAKLKSDFKVPEKRFTWLKARSLVEQKNWDLLDKFAKANAKTFSLGSIVELLIKAREYGQARMYAEQLVNSKTPQGIQEGNTYLSQLPK
ncbi:Vps16, N-terminal region-domain-containing protein [Zopfochytrium polystomum]|nr:Vps16, N-terminal region-domain-containing protein [Zopfochytrium polystomum]